MSGNLGPLALGYTVNTEAQFLMTPTPEFFPWCLLGFQMKSKSERNSIGIKMLKLQFLLKLLHVILSVVIESPPILHAFEFIHSQFYPEKVNPGISTQCWQRAYDNSSPPSLILSWL